MVFHRCFIAVHSSWLDRHQIVLCPDVQPFSYRQLAGGFVGAIVQRRRDLAQLLRHFLLRLSSDAALDLLARAGVEALCVAALPIGIGFPFRVVVIFLIEPAPPAPFPAFVRGIYAPFRRAECTISMIYPARLLCKFYFRDEELYFRRNSSRASRGIRICLPIRTLRICPLRISS